MAAFNQIPDGIKTIKLEGDQLKAAKTFAAMISEGHAEIRAARDVFTQQVQAINDRLQIMLKEEWRKIVEPHGYDASKVWDENYLLLDCDYIEHGIAVLRESPHEGEDVKAATALEGMTLPVGTRLN